MKNHNLKMAVLFVGLCEAAGLLGSAFTVSGIPSWYVWLSKPFFGPPNWLFGPIWIILYALMGVAAYLVWNKSKKSTKMINYAKTAFCWQLSFNICWTVIFFGMRSIFNGLLDIVALWLTLVLTVALFYKVSSKAALLMVPYLVWVTFALALNFYIWKLN